MIFFFVALFEPELFQVIGKSKNVMQRIIKLVFRAASREAFQSLVSFEKPLGLHCVATTTNIQGPYIIVSLNPATSLGCFTQRSNITHTRVNTVNTTPGLSPAPHVVSAVAGDHK